MAQWQGFCQDPCWETSAPLVHFYPYNLHITYGGRGFKMDSFMLGLIVTVLSRTLSMWNCCKLPGVMEIGRDTREGAGGIG